jgi:centromeric protein E
VLGVEQPTQKVFDSIARDLILSVMNGFNGTIFAYGQTSSGKTHTMLGTDETPGIIPLSMNEIFSYIVKVLSPGSHLNQPKSLFEHDVSITES